MYSQTEFFLPAASVNIMISLNGEIDTGKG